MHLRSVGISLHLIGIVSLLVLDIGLAVCASESPAKGKEEGQVVLYTSLNLLSVPKLTEPFSKKYPGIKVEVIRGVATGLVPRIMTESKAGKSGDLVFTKAEYLDLLKNQALLQRYKSTEDIMGDGYVSGVWCSVHGIAYNTRMIPANRVPKSYTDLLDPRWKGKMVVNLTNFMWTHGMLKLYGQDKGTQFLKTLAKQNPRAERASSLTAQLVAAGEFEIGIPLNTNIVTEMRVKGAPIDWARITDPLFADLQAIGILSKGRNTSAARLFMDFVLSKEGQQILAETGRTVLRSDVPMSDGINPEKLQIIGPEARIDPDKYQALMIDLFTK
jgi:iron(III) transport system substrate-binding protein